ncbi:MAG TPA: hypothetical protein DCE56_24960 [Cyanobacteria bacterium UBA8553]|nr:hypothetical protein [Cyanobacteria bacterium UBA8553]HAJ62488.1 hypothetical protein [Cyanobacteria bacterium UBA8543]
MKKTLLVSSICFLLAGGGFKPATAPVSAEVPSANNQLVSDSTPTSSTVQTKVELLNAGTEPKQELRFKPQVNAKQTVTLTMNMDMTSSVEGRPMPKFQIPASTMKMEAVVTQVDPNGDIHFQFNYTDADVVADATAQPEIINAMRSTLKKMVGLKGTFVSDNRGQVKSGNFVLPEGLDPMTKQLLQQVSNSLTQLSAPVPAEAIGKGAKWRVTSSLNLAGINLSQSSIYELASFQDNVANLNVTLEQQATSQALNLPNLPADATMTLKSLKSQGQGQMNIRLDAAMPMQANISVNSNGEMSVKGANNGKETTVSTQLTMQMALESQLPK